MENQTGNFRPQLKKIKRPINRLLPQTSAVAPENTTQLAENAAVSQESLNSFLDNTAVPVKENNQPVLAEEPHEPQYIDEEAYDEEVYGRTEASTPSWLTTKIMVLIACVSLFVGFVIGKFIFAESKVVRNGLQGVVVNAEVPRGRARCGVAERTQGCVLYLMNPQRQDMRAKDFYDLASQMTGRQRFMIETGNMRYANTKIKPGDLVQLNIPPL